MQHLRNRLFVTVQALSQGQKQFVLLLIDIALAPLALFFTCQLVFNSIYPETLLAQIWPLFAVLPFLSAIWSVALGIPKIKLKAFESLAILTTGVFAALLAASFWSVQIMMDRYFPGAGVILFGLVFFLLSVTVRVAMLHMFLWVLRLGKPRCRVLVYGAGTTGMQLVAALKNHETIVPVAFVDDNKALHNNTISGLRVLSPDHIATIVRNRNIDRVILSMPSASAPRQAQVARRLQTLGLDVFAVPSFSQLIGTEALVDHLAPIVPGKFLGRKQMDHSLQDGAEAYHKRTILVSGAGGSIGSEICRQLLNHRPRKLVLFEVSEVALYNIDRELRELAEGSTIEVVAVLGTVTDSRIARMVMTDHAVEVVIHAAAYKHVPMVERNPIAGLANNVLGTRTLADAAEAAGVGRFILISTDKAVRPTNIMGASKRLAEMVIQDLAKRSRGTVFSMVRFGNVLGSSGSVIPLFREQIARGGPVTVTHEDVTRYFMTLSEAVRLVLLAGSYTQAAGNKGGDVFVLDMGKPIRIRDLAEQMIREAGYTVRSETNPDGDIDIQVIGLRPGEKMHEELLIGEGLLTTPHPKILRARESSLSELEMAKALQSLRSAVASGDVVAARAVAATYVEGYVAPDMRATGKAPIEVAEVAVPVA
ncbi:MAG: polysaccharide biosynthesis protein [Paracoccaceae bacterium]